MLRITQIAFSSIFVIVILLVASCTSFSTQPPENAEQDALPTQTTTVIKPTGTPTDSTPIDTQEGLTPAVLEVFPSPTPLATETQTPAITVSQIEVESSDDLLNSVSEEAVILYTKPVNTVFPLYSWPLMPVLDNAQFANVYGDQIGYRYGDDLAPQLSPSGRYLVVPKVDWKADMPATPEDSTTWIVDLVLGSIQEIEQRPMLAIWSPDYDELAFIRDETLYIQDVADQESTPVFTQPGLENLFFDWSPTGQQLAVVSTVIGESIDGSYPPITSTLRIVDAQSGTQRPLESFSIVPIEHDRREFQWSVDGTAVFVGLTWPNHIYTLTGEQISLKDGDKGLGWGYNESQFIIDNENGLFIIDLHNQRTEQIDDTGTPLSAWSISKDRRYLAYSRNRKIYIVDLVNEFQTIAISVPANIVSSLHWSPTGKFLIFDDGDWNTPIWSISVEDKQIGVLIEFGLLLNVIKPPMLSSGN